MPELPEVEVVRRGLAPHVIDRRITGVHVHEPRSIRRHASTAEDFTQRLIGMRVRALVRRGKFLWWLLADPQDPAEVAPYALLTHLGMSGQLRVDTRVHESPLPESATTPPPEPAAQPPGTTLTPENRHCRISLALNDGARVDFIDQRIFGGMWLSPLIPTPDRYPGGMGADDPLIPRDARSIARDVLDPHLPKVGVVSTIKTRNATIKSLLLNQQVVSGIGNIYADEALWAARVRYDTPGSALSTRKIRRILEETASVMHRALAAGGTSFDALYVNVDGRSGYFARSLNVYGKTGTPCPRCGRLIKRDVHQGRSSHFCARCQLPARRALSTTRPA